MDQISVGAMNFEDAKPGFDGAAGGTGEGIDHAADFIFGQCAGHGVIFRKGDGAGGYRDPSAILERNCAAASPGPVGAAFASGVSELHAGDGALTFEDADYARQKFDVRIFPDSQVFGTDASFGRYGGGFGEDQAGTAYRAAA